MIMKEFVDGKYEEENREIPPKEKFLYLLNDLRIFTEDEQKQKIEEMNELIDEISEDEFESVLSKEIFDKIYEMIEKKKLSMGNAILLLKRIEYCTLLKRIWNEDYHLSLLRKMIKKMMKEEERKKEKKNEMLLVDLCECYAMPQEYEMPKELLDVCVPCLLKVALNKERSKEAQREVEMALITLNCIYSFEVIEKEMFLNEIKEIIQYHQEHHNLTWLAYQSAWQFLIERLYNNNNLKRAVVNELRFVKEATNELEELTKYVNWKKEKGQKETKEIRILKRWQCLISVNFCDCRSDKNECVDLIECIIRLYWAARDTYAEIVKKCFDIFAEMMRQLQLSVIADYFLKGGAFGFALWEIQQSTLNDEISCGCMRFFLETSISLKSKMANETDEAKRKVIKKETLDKMEEEGYEDAIASFHKKFDYLNSCYFSRLAKNIADYFVNI
ncbi:uncharacterized protein MONOS_6818 [Monocercomonoides exilis]|uniref:uncharacterized protein n=1 Tax=Monocercomonoides exilis TaxID=2049356 RepID=UPI00355AA731|nr:hypothetical protein MONOS_6818 [Monocercomonoides exilis]|eukprot:MONOS_6818.1-p1 / transcript=MONOS_6818.1 / gene=MONOS_6818 / organism=Monocercomonoides_exilis_PA203 / gene_product=unspecified product / transcript_product=unspecified product / location=Mono_scaffold00222:33511-35032(-) / protein_length=445 / sequence_SO=supercontig / SO=protein_coding / is_pseudo=false